MNSTDDAELQRFHREHLVPAAEALRERGVRFFPLGPEPEADTWYSPAPEGPDFFRLDESEVGDRLRAMWQADETVELAAIVDALMELAGRLEVAEEETPDISPFVYVMY